MNREKIAIAFVGATLAQTLGCVGSPPNVGDEAPVPPQTAAGTFPKLDGSSKEGALSAPAGGSSEDDASASEETDGSDAPDGDQDFAGQVDRDMFQPDL